MAGFFGLFGKNDKYIDDTSSDSNSNKQQDFFLDNDEAISLGNVEYMRQTKKIRRTFPKVRGSKGAELIQEVSATDKVNIKGDRAVSSTETTPTASSTFADTNTETTQRRTADSSMDMFLNMAREIKK